VRWRRRVWLASRSWVRAVVVVPWVARKEEAIEDAAGEEGEEGGGLAVKVRVVVKKRRRDRVAIAVEEVLRD